jgi:hypothetical protein
VLAIPHDLGTLHRGADAGHVVLWDAPHVVEESLQPFVRSCAELAGKRT